MPEDKSSYLLQALANCFNYINTGRKNKAIELVSFLNNNFEEKDEIYSRFMELIFHEELQIEKPNFDDIFGKFWQGEFIEENQSLEIFCDQGIGDTLNLLRYVNAIKEKYKCKIVLNCYAFFNHFEEFIKHQSYIDELVWSHKKCDYVTNIMSIPSILHEIPLDVRYPVHFEEVQKKDVLKNIRFENFQKREIISDKTKVGVAWKTNAENPLSLVKSIPIQIFSLLKSNEFDFFCLQPCVDFPDWIKPLDIENLKDTAECINAMDFIVSVDTAVLHLAGCLGKFVYGLLPFDCDPRWGKNSSCVWYENIVLYRQLENFDWSKALSDIKDDIKFNIKEMELKV